MSPQLFVLPASGKNFRASLAQPISPDLYQKHLTRHEVEELEGNLEALDTEPMVHAWGASDGSKSHWDNLRSGDYVLVYYGQRYRWFSQVVGKTRNAALAAEIWENGEKWSQVFFLTRLHPVNVSEEIFGGVLPFPCMAFMRAVSAMQRIQQRFGSIPDFIREVSREDKVEPAPNTPSLDEFCEAFADALERSHLIFGSQHIHVVRAFVASAATKRFIILSGLSGSGKSQIALRFGEWLGGSRYFASIPVRPDWTSPESLLGYEDALMRSRKGSRTWNTPEALRFMIRAAERPERPSLLLLDEMNLAHVERYFADLLSGMESDYPVLPNISKEGDAWVQNRQIPLIPVPKNVIVVGTVNVDETTYTFSPKVLDRANTLEFRVAAEDLREDARRPTACDAASGAMLRSFYEVMVDDGWHHKNPSPHLGYIAEELRSIHSALSPEGFEFGHRTFYEALRFSSILYACGEDDKDVPLDLQVMQKILPRLHGSRRRLEAVLIRLARFCLDGDLGDQGVGAHFDPSIYSPEEARLPISFNKLTRMINLLRANQFVTFAE